mmetsp:Transcript_1892/g.5176  ORF Transcript_1892/g.5176 Transcript_1892/m.5176 type:complete len:423 (+) Transcript_1892:201-1469(+)
MLLLLLLLGSKGNKESENSPCTTFMHTRIQNTGTTIRITPTQRQRRVESEAFFIKKPIRKFVPTAAPSPSEPTPTTSTPTAPVPTVSPTTSSNPTLTAQPTPLPTTALPTPAPTPLPSFAPVTQRPSTQPTTALPTPAPTPLPSFAPVTSQPTTSNAPTVSPTNPTTSIPTADFPTFDPASENVPTQDPANLPTQDPATSGLSCRPAPVIARPFPGGKKGKKSKKQNYYYYYYNRDRKLGENEELDEATMEELRSKMSDEEIGDAKRELWGGYGGYGGYHGGYGGYYYHKYDPNYWKLPICPKTDVPTMAPQPVAPVPKGKGFWAKGKGFAKGAPTAPHKGYVYVPGGYHAGGYDGYYSYGKKGGGYGGFWKGKGKGVVDPAPVFDAKGKGWGKGFAKGTPVYNPYQHYNPYFGKKGGKRRE